MGPLTRWAGDGFLRGFVTHGWLVSPRILGTLISATHDGPPVWTSTLSAILSLTSPTQRRRSFIPTVAEDRGQQRRRARLVEGSLPLPHLGDCTHDGHPREHGHCSIVSSVAASQRSAVAESALDDPGAARIAVVDEDRAAGRCPDAAASTRRPRPSGRTSPPAAGARSPRARPRGRRRELRARDRGSIDDRLRDRPPHRLRLEVLRRERERDLVDDRRSWRRASSRSPPPGSSRARCRRTRRRRRSAPRRRPRPPRCR